MPTKPLNHVIARSEATRQSLTERNGIPERNLEKQRETVCVLQARHHLLLSVSCSRASPRDAIPQALRLPRRCAPRNDTELERFYLDNERFAFFAVIFCAVLLSTVFQTFRSGNCFVFPQNLPDLSLRGGRNFSARRGNL